MPSRFPLDAVNKDATAMIERYRPNLDEEQKAASAKAKADIEALIDAITSPDVKTAVHALFTDILNYGSVCSAQKLRALEQTASALADYVTQEGNPVDEIR